MNDFFCQSNSIFCHLICNKFLQLDPNMSVTKTQQKKQEQDKMLLIIFILLISPTSVKLEKKCVITSRPRFRKIKHRIELCSNVDFKKHPRCVDQCSEGIFVDLIILT